MAKSPTPKADTDTPEWNFEESLTALQQIVDDLEAGELGLDESMQRFEQGIGLLRGCYHTLEAAEQKIEILTGTDEAGNPLTAAFDATATIEQKKTSAGRRKRKSNKAESNDESTSASAAEQADPGERLF
jgi:exodeoxyribonuclease VII small subunit